MLTSTVVVMWFVSVVVCDLFCLLSTADDDRSRGCGPLWSDHRYGGRGKNVMSLSKRILVLNSPMCTLNISIHGWMNSFDSYHIS